VRVDSDALYTLGESSARAQTFERTLVATGTLGVTKGPVPEIPAFDDPEPDSVMAPMTDADGRFVVRDLAPGVYRLRAVHGRYAQSGQLEVQVRASEVRTGVRLVLRTGQPLTGRVLDGNSRPILGALVELDDGSAFETNDRGVFDAGFRRGRQTLLVRAPGKASERVEVRVDDDPIDVQIVLEDAEGALEGQALQMLDEVTPTLVAFTDERGAFEFQSLPTGPAELELDHPDFVPVTQRVQVQRAGRGQPIEVQLRSGWTLEVWVVEQGTQDPVRGAVVAAGGQHARTDAEGHAVLSRLSSDRVRVDVDAEDRSARPVMVNRPDGDRTQIEVTVVEGGGLEGTVSDYRGDGVAGAHVVVRDASDHGVLAQTVSGAGGRWSVDGVPEGDVVVEVFPPDSRADDLAEVAQPSDVLRGHVTRDVDVRFDRR
jgi:protocatechuate 3,4-dioxygenase beta subunit